MAFSRLPSIFYNTWESANGYGRENENNFLLWPCIMQITCTLLFSCVIGLNMYMSSLISTTIILSLYALRNYNHLPHNYNFKALYWGPSDCQKNNRWEKTEIWLFRAERRIERKGQSAAGLSGSGVGRCWALADNEQVDKLNLKQSCSVLRYPQMLETDGLTPDRISEECAWRLGIETCCSVLLPDYV